MSGELPEGWVAAALGTVTTKIGSGATPRGGSAAYASTGIPLIRSQNIYFDAFRDDGLVYLGRQQAAALDGVTVKSADVLLNITGASIGRACVAPERMTNARVNQHVAIIRPKEGSIIPLMLAMYLESPSVQMRINTEEYGVTRQALTKAWIEGLEVPIAPLSEQRRIVEKVEALLADVNKAKERLDRVPLILKRFRQAVLAAACSGELTKEWRERHGSRSSAATMLGDLFVERRREHERATASARVNGSRKPTTPKNLEPAQVPGDLSELPDGWTWVLFDDICDDITVGHVGPMAKEYVEHGVPFLRSQNVRPFRFDSDGLKFVTRAFHERLAKSALKPGDLVVVRSGNAGEACVIPPELPAANCADLVVMRPSRALNPSYGAIFINSSAARAHIQDVKVGIAQGHYNIGSARETPVPLPPLPEQAAIVEAVHRMFALADAIERRIKVATAQGEKLPQAILAKAFSGELVPTEAELARAEGRTYETAEELLARVRGEAENMGPTKRPKPSSKRKRLQAAEE